MKIETVGMSGESASSEGNLVGIIDAEVFRNAVLAQRQRVIDAESGRSQQSTGVQVTPIEDKVSSGETLAEIRDILVRIERQLSERN